MPVCVQRTPPAPPVRLVFGPVLVHRRHTLSAFAAPCVETEPPGHHWDSRAASQWMLGSGVAPELIVWWNGKRGRPLAVLGPAPILNGDQNSDRIAGCAVLSRTRPCCPSAWSRAVVRNHQSPRWWWHARSRGLSRLPQVPGTGPSHHRACQLLSGQSYGCGSWISSKPDWMRRTPPARPCVWSSVRACPAAIHPIRKCNPMRGYAAICPV